ncbi:MAG: hypothetical protein LQ340_004930 [Diploschistes diacapsis]|nr:MAG: hypothetical protein LQ340_004930 [Diploschistes diacapsis]
MSSYGDDITPPPSAQPRSPIVTARESQLSEDLQSLPDPQVDGHNYRYDSDPPDLDRPNKFHGPASTWRDWTAAERDIARSLDQLKAQDLSVHLYNAHALKPRVCDGRSPTNVWKPPKLWTAWPMKSDEVPRHIDVSIDDCFNVNGHSLATKPVSDSREHLMVTLLATLIRKARERYYGLEGTRERPRMSEWPKPERNPDSSSRGSRGSKPPTEGSHHGSLPASRAPSLGLFYHDTEVKISGASLADKEQGKAGEQAINGIAKTAFAQSSNFQGSSAGSKTGSESPTETIMYKPVPLADEASARRIAQPPLSHVISRLEMLLDGLHKAQQFRRKNAPSRSPRKRIPKLPSRSLPRRRGEQSFDELSERQRSKAPVNQISNSTDSEYQTSEARSSEAQSSSSRKRRVQQSGRVPLQPKTIDTSSFGLRDWSDVLGLAAIQGWDERVIERTRKRCSALFKERMELTTLGFGDELETNDTSDLMKVASEDEMEGGVHVDGFLKPIKRRRGWHGKNKEKGNWRSRRKESEGDKRKQRANPESSTDSSDCG